MTIRGLSLVPTIQVTTIRVGIIKTRWNPLVVDAIVDGVVATLKKEGIETVVTEEVGGAFELPFAVSVMAKSGDFDVIIPVGCLIKGATMHFEYISGASVDGLMRVSLDSGIPVINGILNVLTEDQALERAGLKGNHGNEGVGWALTAIQQVNIARKYERK
jgi:6,7-dimethyl-8-ribityllumazine synthase